MATPVVTILPMSDELRELAGCLRTYLQFHGRGRFFITGAWQLPPIPEAAREHPVETVSEAFAETAAVETLSDRPAPEEAPLPLAPDLGQPADMEGLWQAWGACTRCRLAEGRTHLVFGEGAVPSSLMFIGEGPGEQEDLQGRPFVGRAGELLTRMIEAMGLRRESVYIANIVKCRPPGNRDPEPDEVEACLPVLLEQIRLVQPRVIVSLGRVSAQTLLATSTPVSRLRGKWHRFLDIDLMPTFHPAYLLRSPEKKKEAWLDLQAVMKKLEEIHG